MGIPERWKRHRPLPADIEERLESLAPILRKEGVLLAYIFGSLASTDEKTLRAPGDVDLAMLTKEGPAWKLWEVLADALGTSILGSGGPEKGLAGAALRNPAQRQADLCQG